MWAWSSEDEHSGKLSSFQERALYFSKHRGMVYSVYRHSQPLLKSLLTRHNIYIIMSLSSINREVLHDSRDWLNAHFFILIRENKKHLNDAFPPDYEKEKNGHRQPQNHINKNSGRFSTVG